MGRYTKRELRLTRPYSSNADSGIFKICLLLLFLLCIRSGPRSSNGTQSDYFPSDGLLPQDDFHNLFISRSGHPGL